MPLAPLAAPVRSDQAGSWRPPGAPDTGEPGTEPFTGPGWIDGTAPKPPKPPVEGPAGALPANCPADGPLSRASGVANGDLGGTGPPLRGIGGAACSRATIGAPRPASARGMSAVVG